MPVVALVVGGAAAAISAHVHRHPVVSAAALPAAVEPASKASAAPHGTAGFDVVQAWNEAQALLYARTAPYVRSMAAWAPAGGFSAMPAARSPDANQTGADNAKVAAVPLPPPRAGGIARRAAAPGKPVQIEPQLASLPPQPQEPGTFGFFSKLFADPDQAAKNMLAANPKTAVYDIVKRVVYLPDGEKLEAHSGLGKWMDDPASVEIKNHGVTPPNVYTLSFREKLFHGVRALRMKPVGGGNMYGRDGILAHSYLLGEQGASNGCISLRDYDRFLQAYEDGKFDRIIVVFRADEPGPARVASAQSGGV